MNRVSIIGQARLILTFTAVLCLGLCLGIGAVWAQEDESPLRLAFINTSGSAGAGAYNSVSSVLKQSDQISVVPGERLLREAEGLGLTIESFQQGSQRETNVAAFRQLMSNMEIEGILVQDVYSGGNMLQLVVIGPRGAELRDLRRNTKSGRISDEDTVEMLRDVFMALVPEVRQFRRELAEEREHEAQLAAEREAKAEEDRSIKQDVVARHRNRYGNLERGLEVHAGFLGGQRAMVILSDDGFRLSHGSPFFGVGGRAEGIIEVFSGNSSALGGALFGAYAPFETEFGTEQLASAYTRLGAELSYVQGLAPYALARFYVGAEAMSVTVTANDIYTGHRYISARAGAGIHYRFGSFATMDLAAGVLPLLDKDNSNGGFGEVEGFLGFDGTAQLNLVTFDSIAIAVGYSFQYYKLAHPDAPQLAARADATDMIHVALFSVGYRTSL